MALTENFEKMQEIIRQTPSPSDQDDLRDICRAKIPQFEVCVFMTKPAYHWLIRTYATDIGICL